MPDFSMCCRAANFSGEQPGLVRAAGQQAAATNGHSTHNPVWPAPRRMLSCKCPRLSLAVVCILYVKTRCLLRRLWHMKNSIAVRVQECIICGTGASRRTRRGPGKNTGAARTGCRTQEDFGMLLLGEEEVVARWFASHRVSHCLLPRLARGLYTAQHCVPCRNMTP
jgi:hypothetical protein